MIPVIHGKSVPMAADDPSWYFTQQASANGEAKYYALSKNALLQFVSDLNHSLASTPMFQYPINTYFGGQFGA